MENNKRVQELADVLTVGEKYTMFFENDMGFVAKLHFKLTRPVERCKYAQYEDAVKMVFRQPRKRKDQGLTLYSGKSIVVFQGFVESNYDQFSKPVLSCDPAIFQNYVKQTDGEKIFLFKGRY